MSQISPTLKANEGNQIFTVAAGCFWGTENIYRKHFGNRGLVDGKVGYANGVVANPSYVEVCKGTTNHAEALQISYDPELVSLKELVKFFYLMHDPTTLNAQGPKNRGTQYRSAIFYSSAKDAVQINEVEAEVQAEYYPNHSIVTVKEPLEQFWDAEDYHQLYLLKNPEGYACPSHYLRTSPKVEGSPTTSA
ncbi:hypothetical protein BABINDRAFT_163047 [Babjeviella inositovora NRRL Y-12698]|uniref:peptide-methionine (S)-S-oxide reductase n=1 Tax=Babjeviella inositovora NRRL Y-12698 TaxID=984486 RepID=A0A1E3QLY7_9ASCO|nr:uncharacterized protein BABINDRAFT_163047 [Babjeviella inositovora NRRL Y-12698]ODQ77997.1 hypothetical protein BABINDRAFT_163047 [Babjeviella inositovora NRRL Y-12698]